MEGVASAEVASMQSAIVFSLGSSLSRYGLIESVILLQRKLCQQFSLWDFEPMVMPELSHSDGVGLAKAPCSKASQPYGFA